MSAVRKHSARRHTKDTAVYIRVRMDRPRMRLLRKFYARHGGNFSKCDLADLLQHMLTLSLINPESALRAASAFCRYRDLEGFGEAGLSGAAVQMFVEKAAKS